ncbi:MAG TPA: hypothetical protein VFM18_06130, partial [Methanosarcina sp.]|nr:hypothetical protein [Methanosarcina sp.]
MTKSLEQVAKIIKAISYHPGFDRVAKALEYAIQKVIELIGKYIDLRNAAAEYFGLVEKHSDPSIWERTTSAVRTLNQAFFELNNFASNFGTVLQSLNNPAVVGSLDNILVSAQAIAEFRGYDRLADGFDQARGKLQAFSAEAEELSKKQDIQAKEILDQQALVAKVYLATTDVMKAATIGFGTLFSGIFASRLIANISAFQDKFGGLASFFGASTTQQKAYLLQFANVFTQTFRDSIGLFGQFVSFFVNGFKNGFGKFGEALKDLVTNIPHLYKGLGIASFLLANLGTLMSQNVVGSLAMVEVFDKTSLSLLAMSVGIKLVLHELGSFISSIGGKLIEASENFTNKFAKSQQIVSQFGFVVKNFGNAYGASFIGSLEQWEDRIKSLAETSTFSSNEIRKATKIVIAENQSLGMSYEENVKFLNRAVEIAASSGLELIDVVQRLQSGLMGNSQAVAALGINLSSHALEHSKLNEQINKTVETMTAQEKQQIALAEIYKQTEPLV